jgi:hypothetical protein
MQATFKMIDDSGFLAVINADRYASFVDEDWSFQQLLEHLILQSNTQNLIIWGTGLENTWNVTFLDNPSPTPAFREFTQPIAVTDGRLYLTNYEDLTMAAQFQHHRLPAKHNANAFITLPNGLYTLTIRQFGDPTDYNLDADSLRFEIVVRPAAANHLSTEINGITWFELE